MRYAVHYYASDRSVSIFGGGVLGGSLADAEHVQKQNGTAENAEAGARDTGTSALTYTPEPVTIHPVVGTAFHRNYSGLATEAYYKNILLS
jgi:hypothetical protein